MPTATAPDTALMDELLAESLTGLQAASITNPHVSVGKVYEEEAPEQTWGTVYAIVSVPEAFPHTATDRVRQFTDHLITVTIWGPDVRSGKEAMKAVRERLTAKSNGAVTNLSMSGYVITDSRVQYQRTVSNHRGRRGQSDTMHGQTLGLRLVCYPTS